MKVTATVNGLADVILVDVCANGGDVYTTMVGDIVDTAVKGTSGGADYVVGDRLTIADQPGAVFEVASLGALDAIATVTIVNKGFGAVAGADKSAVGGTGTGGQLDIGVNTSLVVVRSQFGDSDVGKAAAVIADTVTATA